VDILNNTQVAVTQHLGYVRQHHVHQLHQRTSYHQILEINRVLSVSKQHLTLQVLNATVTVPNLVRNRHLRKTSAKSRSKVTQQTADTMEIYLQTLYVYKLRVKGAYALRTGLKLHDQRDRQTDQPEPQQHHPDEDVTLEGTVIAGLDLLRLRYVLLEQRVVGLLVLEVHVVELPVEETVGLNIP
jgi:hypothetical protein